MTRFHLENGLYFERLSDGDVRITKVDFSKKVTVRPEFGDDVFGHPVIFQITTAADSWASVIATMSYYGENDYGWYRARNFHEGEPIGETTPLNQEKIDKRLEYKAK